MLKGSDEGKSVGGCNRLDGGASTSIRTATLNIHRDAVE